MKLLYYIFGRSNRSKMQRKLVTIVALYVCSSFKSYVHASSKNAFLLASTWNRLYIEYKNDSIIIIIITIIVSPNLLRF